MDKNHIEIKNFDFGDNNLRNLTRKELQAWGTKIIADARQKNHKKSRVTKKNRMSRKEYIESLDMREKWWSHYGRNPWY